MRSLGASGSARYRPKSAKAGTTLLDAHAFSVGLKECVNVLYASACTWTILCSDSHKYSKEKRAAYRESGWTTFEELLSNMVKHSDKVIDLPGAGVDEEGVR